MVKLHHSSLSERLVSALCLFCCGEVGMTIIYRESVKDSTESSPIKPLLANSICSLESLALLAIALEALVGPFSILCKERSQASDHLNPLF